MPCSNVNCRTHEARHSERLLWPYGLVSQVVLKDPPLHPSRNPATFRLTLGLRKAFYVCSIYILWFEVKNKPFKIFRFLIKKKNQRDRTTQNYLLGPWKGGIFLVIITLSRKIMFISTSERHGQPEISRWFTITILFFLSISRLLTCSIAKRILHSTAVLINISVRIRSPLPRERPHSTMITVQMITCWILFTRYVQRKTAKKLSFRATSHRPTIVQKYPLVFFLQENYNFIGDYYFLVIKM